MVSQDNIFESAENHQKYVKIDFFPPPSHDDDYKQDYLETPSKKKDRLNYTPESEFGDERDGPFYESKPLQGPKQSTIGHIHHDFKSVNEELKRKQKEKSHQQPINKSISFSTKSSSPQAGSEVGLLTTVNNPNDHNSNDITTSDKSSSSLATDGQSSVNVPSKMVTFSSNSMTRKNKSNSTTTETGSTIVTTANINNNDVGSGSGSGSTASTGTSASPSVSSSSANNDLDVSNEAPLTVSDQSFILQRPNKLTMSNLFKTSFFK